MASNRRKSSSGVARGGGGGLLFQHMKAEGLWTYCKHSCKHTDTYYHAHWYIRASTPTQTCKHTNTNVQAHWYVRASKMTHKCKLTDSFLCTVIYTRKHMHAQHTHACTHAHAFTQSHAYFAATYITISMLWCRSDNTQKFLACWITSLAFRWCLLPLSCRRRRPSLEASAASNDLQPQPEGHACTCSGGPSWVSSRSVVARRDSTPLLNVNLANL
jgi:hypothetical protein